MLVALPFVVGDDGVANEPNVSENVTMVQSGIAPPAAVFALAELNVKSAVMVDDPPGSTVAGEALDFNSRNGVVVTGPATPFGVLAHPAPPAPGP
jgi:predicted TIM-barrel enzyme